MAWACTLLRNAAAYGCRSTSKPVSLISQHTACLVERKFGQQQIPTLNYCVQTRDKGELLTSDAEELDTLYQRLTVEVRGHEPAVLKSYEFFACEAAKELGISVANTFVPPKHIKRYDALKSVHIFKKHIVQYEFRTYFRVIELKHLTGSTADTYLEYIQRNLPEGVAMKVTKQAMEKIPQHIRRPVQSQ